VTAAEPDEQLAGFPAVQADERPKNLKRECLAEKGTL
jgi:hypothetical protein